MRKALALAFLLVQMYATAYASGPAPEFRTRAGAVLDAFGSVSFTADVSALFTVGAVRLGGRLGTLYEPQLKSFCPIAMACIGFWWLELGAGASVWLNRAASAPFFDVAASLTMDVPLLRTKIGEFGLSVFFAMIYAPSPAIVGGALDLSEAGLGDHLDDLARNAWPFSLYCMPKFGLGVHYAFPR